MREDDPRGSEHGGSGRTRGRKERVLHTRVSDALAEDIRRMAEDLRVPASNLVRNVLEEAFSMVEAVSENVGDLIEDVFDGADRARERIRRRHRRPLRRKDPPRPEAATPPPERDEFSDVIGWQSLILNRPERCADCGEPLEGGQQAYFGLSVVGAAGAAGAAAGAAGAPPTVLCGDCMDTRRR